jgi:DNA polymerase sigma
LALVSDALKSVEGYVVEEIFNARVPILTLKCKRDDTTLKADLSFSNFLALKNTKMLAVYAAFDDRVAPLGIAIKKWANIVGLNNASNGTFKSYGEHF